MAAPMPVLAVNENKGGRSLKKSILSFIVLFHFVTGAESVRVVDLDCIL